MYDKDNHLNRSKTYKRKRKKWRKYISISLLTILLIALGTTGYTYWKVNQFLGQVTVPEPAKELEPTAHNDNSKEAAEDEKKEPNVFTVLIVGVDYRPVLGSLNTDVMMLASINADDKRISLVSIPRDTHIDLDNYREMKMNAVFAQGESERRQAERNGETPEVTGPTLLKQAVGELFNVPVDYYVRVDFEGFTKIIDELGGIKVEVDRNMRYVDTADGTDINLKKGEQVLSGKEALDFVRFRESMEGHGPDSNDYERNERQQKVVKASVGKMKSFAGIFNFFDVLEAAGDHIRTDIDQEILKNLALTFRSGVKEIRTIETNAYWAKSQTIIDRKDRERISDIFIQERLGEKTTSSDSSLEAS